MSRINQLIKISRKKKVRRFKTPALQKCPQKKGMCLKLYTQTPKKPNSALRKMTRLALSNRLRVAAHIPGEKHALQEYAIVLMRGGRVKDLPGVKYRLIRGCFDLLGVRNRKTARSKYGIRKRL